MKTYEVFTSELDGTQIKATEGEKVIWIPTDESNRHYAEYLRYAEWVEAGNDPQDFWTQETE